MTFWIDGELVDDAVVPVTDHGFTVGDGVFETLRTDGGVPRALDRHLDRLARSATGLGLCVPDRALLERAVNEVVAANGGGDLRVRLTVTAGPGPMGSPRGSGQCTVVAGATPVHPVEPVTDVITVPWVR